MCCMQIKCSNNSISADKECKICAAANVSKLNEFELIATGHLFLSYSHQIGMVQNSK